MYAHAHKRLKRVVPVLESTARVKENAVCAGWLPLIRQLRSNARIGLSPWRDRRACPAIYAAQHRDERHVHLYAESESPEINCFRACALVGFHLLGLSHTYSEWVAICFSFVLSARPLRESVRPAGGATALPSLRTGSRQTVNNLLTKHKEGKTSTY